MLTTDQILQHSETIIFRYQTFEANVRYHLVDQLGIKQSEALEYISQYQEKLQFQFFAGSDAKEAASYLIYLLSKRQNNH